MPRFAIKNHDCLTILANEQLVRVSFRDGDYQYLIPLGYVWHNAALYGVTERGRKLTMAEANPTVAFQVDTSGRTGMWEWGSVTGDGEFHVVSDPQERETALEALMPIVGQAPDWWHHEQGPRLAAGELVVWKLEPTHISGCRYTPPEDAEID